MAERGHGKSRPDKAGAGRGPGREELSVRQSGEGKDREKVKAFTIRGRLSGLNEYIAAERTNRYKAAQMKRDCETLVILSARKGLGRWKAHGPVYMKYLWVEKDRRRDLDNISGYGRKIIQDSLVKGGWLKNDGQKNIVGFSDDFAVDKGDPRIEIEIVEVDT